MEFRNNPLIKHTMPVFTRAAAAAYRQSTQHDILGLVVCNAHHVLGPRDVCSLLCTSKATAACLSQHMRGQMHVIISPRTLRQAEQLCQWLVKNCSLLQSLEFAPQLPQLQQSW